ncbi:AAA domain-containing protein [Carnobacterium inhibens]|uniref:AAA+ ATPase domain-containing protein n=1 Tax=Carnobacterium inhibens subsp. gilichinskyi TaxID=1266845 RepID=U5SG62_9LACT|nr:AAA domain-containing protein [Carnobacterium inhibens]AGY82877.1 hypothetical protein Q783_09960 [Carnobacterium inhibens subsp. gilichinskyi]
MINYVIVLFPVLEKVRQDMLDQGIINISPLQYLTNLVNPDRTGMLYNVVNGDIRILSEKYILFCKPADEKNSIKVVHIRKCTTFEYASFISLCEVLPSDCTIITMEDAKYIEKIPNDFLIQDIIKKDKKNDFDKKKFKEFKDYWKTQDIASKLEKEIINNKKIESVTTFSSIQLKMDISVMELSITMEDYNYQVGEQVIITSNEEWESKFRLDYSHMEHIKGIEIGIIKSCDKDSQTITIEPKIQNMDKILKQVYELEEGYLWVSDIGSTVKKRNEDTALKQLFNNQTANKNLKEFIPEVESAQPSSFEMNKMNKKDFTATFATLNENQRLSVLGAINTEDIFLIQGPPGTGKTTVICEMIQYLAKQGNKILLSAQTHLAVDNVLQRIGEEEEIDAIRIGNNEKVALGNEKYILEQRVEELQKSIVSTTKENKKKYHAIEKDYDIRRQKLISYEYVYEKVDAFMSINKNIEKARNELANLLSEINETEKMSASVTNEINYLDEILINSEDILEQIKNILSEGYSHEKLANLSKFQMEVFISKIDKEAIKEFKSCIIRLKNVEKEEINKLEKLELEKKKILQSKAFYTQKVAFYKAEQHNTGNSYESQIITYEKLEHTYMLECQEKDSQIEHLTFKSEKQSEKINDLVKRASKAKSIITATLDLSKEPLVSILGSKFTFKEFLDFYTQAQLFEWKYGKLPENTMDVLAQISLFDKRKKIKKQLDQLQNHYEDLIKLKTNISDTQSQMRQLIQIHISNDHVHCYLTDTNKEFNQFSTEDLTICSSFINTLNEDTVFMGFYNQTIDIQEEWASRMDVYQTSFEEAYVKSANLISATCLGIATKSNNYFSESEFDYLIIDEAGRASSLELLIPMIRGKKIVLVGDHKQISSDVERELMDKLTETEEIDENEISTYKASLFGLMYEKAKSSNKMFLDTQFRMNSDISKIVSDFYYDGKLLDADKIKERSHGLENKLIQSFYWLNTPGNMELYQESKEGSSPYNKGEIKGTINLLKWLDENISEEKSVGVIAPYKAQTKRLEKEINKVEFNHLVVEVNTIDAFQGREKQIVIMNLVRNNPNNTIGFIEQDSRMNVAFSRAQEMMFVIGNTEFIHRNKMKLPKLYEIVAQLRENNAVKSIEEFAKVGQNAK